MGSLQILYYRLVAAVSKRQRLPFGAMLTVLQVAIGTPITVVADDYLLTAHMVQYVLMTMVIPPLLIYGLGPLTWRRLRGIPWGASMWRLITYPPIALIGFNGVFSRLQYPPVLALPLHNAWAYLALPYRILAMSVAMW